MVPVTSEEKTTSLASVNLCQRFSLPEILSATQNFDDLVVIGQGGFGKVYKGRINNEQSGAVNVVAIKRLDSTSNQGAPEFRAEIEMLSKLRHCHLVSLIGYCDDGKEMILVYEYMPHGTLDYHLHRADTPLSWMQRLSISIGAARGLDYLHTGVGTQHGIIHRDVKSSNILLDENWAPKISDFGLSKVGPTNQPSSYVSASIKGTFGYLDPEFWLSGRLTRKTDVFAFGVVLFELLSGRRAVDTNLEERQWSLARWAQKCVKERKLNQILDSKIQGQISPKCLKEFAQIAYRCLDGCPNERPTMAEVVVALQLSLTLQKKFDKPAQPTGVMGFTRKMQKLIFVSNEVNSAHREIKTSRDIKDRLSANLEDCDHDEVPPRISGKISTPVMKMFSYSELKCATRDFNSRMLLGKGSLGEVFKGWIDEKTYSPSELDVGLAIAVKRLHPSKHKFFVKHKLDLSILREFCHPNFVRPLGYCLEAGMPLIVHEFVQNGSLAEHLFEEAAEPLPSITRVKIAVGVAQGLVFLTNLECQSTDYLLKKHNVLLDEDFNAKLSDCDVLKLARGCKDRMHYYPIPGLFDLKSNRFAFGMLLLELFSGQRITAESESYIERDVNNRQSGDHIWRKVECQLPKYHHQVVGIARSLIDEQMQDYRMQQALKSLEQIHVHMTECLNSLGGQYTNNPTCRPRVVVRRGPDTKTISPSPAPPPWGFELRPSMRTLLQTTIRTAIPSDFQDGLFPVPEAEPHRDHHGSLPPRDGASTL